MNVKNVMWGYALHQLKGDLRWCQNDSRHFAMQPFVSSQSTTENMATYNDLCNAPSCNANVMQCAVIMQCTVVMPCMVGWWNACKMMQHVQRSQRRKVCNAVPSCDEKWNYLGTRQFQVTPNCNLIWGAVAKYCNTIPCQCQGLSWTHGTKT